MVIDQIRAGTGVYDIRAALAIDRLRARTAANRVGDGRAQDRERARLSGGIDVQEVPDRRRTRHVLVGRREIEAHRRIEHQRAVGARTAIDRALQAVVINDVRRRAADDDVARTAIAVDRVRAAAARNRVGSGRARDGQRRGDARGVHVGEAGHRRAARHLIAGIGEVHGRGRIEIERARTRAAIERRFRAVIIDQIRAGAGVDDIRAAVAVDGLCARTAADRIRGGGAEDRKRGRCRGRRDIAEACHRGAAAHFAA